LKNKGKRLPELYKGDVQMVLSMSRPWKHPKTGVYYYRKVVPEAMRQLVGLVEVRRTLGTKDPRQAARRHLEVAANVAAEWEALKQGPSLPDLARRFVQQLHDPASLADDLFEVDLRAAGVMDERELPDEWEAVRTPQRQKAISRVIERRGLASWIEGINQTPLSQGQRARLVESVEAYLLNPSAAPTPATPSMATSLTLTGILDRWWTEAKATGRKPSTHESYRNTVAGLVAFLGHDDAKQVTPEDIVRFKDHRLASINPRTGKPISGKTVKDSDLAGLKTLFGWAVSNRKLPSNPVTGITIKLGKPQKLRGKGLTEDEAKAILQAAMKVTRGGESAGTFAAKRWVPFLAAYTGARVGELAQLRKQDATREGEHWVLLLTPEAGTIKTNEARKVVLHPHLIDLGFPAFLRAAQPGHLFLKPAKDGDVLGPLQGLKNRLAEFVRGIITDPNVAPMHGFRHRFKTVGMDAGVPSRVLDAIQGHAARTAGDGYGDVTVKAMAMAMERVPRVEV
jgi:integrase